MNAEDMAKTYDHKKVEPRIYKMWEEAGAFNPDNVESDDAFCVLMPPPNANAPLHCGHATYAIQDLYTRWYRMKGYKALYLPGVDHAGFETQVVYERKLKKEGKSRFDFDRETLYNDILGFVQENSEVAINQLKKIGMSADWSRNVFMLDDNVVDTVLKTFQKMHEDGLVYRDMYLVNYSPHHGTTFSNLETEHKETISPLYYVSYKVKDSNDTLTVATVRPETIFADVAIAVNPKDKRYKDFVGKTVINPLNDREMIVIEDDYVDVEFGTGALKITPGHDFNDFEIGKKHNLEMISVVNLEGKVIGTGTDVDGMRVFSARKKTVEMLEEAGAIEKVDEKYTNNLLVDYKDGKPIEPMLLPNWFVKMDGLAADAIKALNEDKVKFYRPMWKKEMIRWLENIHDWPISRQIVFGIRMPVWYEITDNSDVFVVFLNDKGESVDSRVGDLAKEYSLEDIEKGLQKLIAPKDTKFVISQDKPEGGYLQETDTFDTWFSSGQWPLTTLGFSHDGNHSKDFKTFFPTTLMDSMWDILFFWIARMIMFSLYLTGEIPFEDVYIHGRIDDAKGQKMSKSKGNVIDPLEFVEEYGADALRMGMFVGGNTLARTTSFNSDKIRGYRNFANKLWNMARFTLMMFEKENIKEIPEFKEDLNLNEKDKEIIKRLEETTNQVNDYLERYRIADAGDTLYHFIWDVLADKYIEDVKNREGEEKIVGLTVLHHTFTTSLKLLHPFMPFVTEEIWQKLSGKSILITQDW